MRKFDFPTMERWFSLLRELGRDLSNPLRMRGPSAVIRRVIPAIWRNHPAFHHLQGETGWLRTASTTNLQADRLSSNLVRS
jgi:hypothetical protein